MVTIARRGTEAHFELRLVPYVKLREGIPAGWRICTGKLSIKA